MKPLKRSQAERVLDYQLSIQSEGFDQGPSGLERTCQGPTSVGLSS